MSSTASVTNEDFVHQFQLKQNVLFPNRKVELKLTSKQLYVDFNNYLLGILPTGPNKLSFPLKSVSSIFITAEFRIKRFLIGLLLVPGSVIFSYATFSNGLVLMLPETFFLMFLCLYLLFTSRRNQILITNHAGQQTSISISSFEKWKLQDVAIKINEAIAEL